MASNPEQRPSFARILEELGDLELEEEREEEAEEAGPAGAAADAGAGAAPGADGSGTPLRRRSSLKAPKEPAIAEDDGELAAGMGE